MAGNKLGGTRTRDTNYERQGSDFYSRIGRIGGLKSRGGGFSWMKANGIDDRIRELGRKGGEISRRKKKDVDAQ